MIARRRLRHVALRRDPPSRIAPKSFARSFTLFAKNKTSLPHCRLRKSFPSSLFPRRINPFSNIKHSTPSYKTPALWALANQLRRVIKKKFLKFSFSSKKFPFLGFMSFFTVSKSFYYFPQKNRTLNKKNKILLLIVKLLSKQKRNKNKINKFFDV